MSVILSKKDLSLGQLQFIRISCTFFLDPLSQEKTKCKKFIESLRSDPTVPSSAIDFALNNFYGPLDPILVKYLGKKLRTSERYQKFQSEIKPPVELFISIGESVIVPLILGNLLTGKLHNMEKEVPQKCFDFTGTLKDNQLELVPTFEKHLDSIGTTIVGLYPGAGKTIIGAYLAAKKKVLCIVFIHLSVQLPQWKNTFEKVTNAKVWTVGDPSSDKLYDYGKHPCDIIICMEERLSKIPRDIVSKIGMVIIDEAHAFCTPSRIPCWLTIQPKYLILETATLKRPDDAMERMAYACAGNWGVFLKSQKNFDVYPIKTGIVADNKLLEKNWSTFLMNLLMNEQRDKQILELVHRNKQRKILILTPRKEHVEHLASLLKAKGYTVSTFYGSADTYKDAPILIGTFSKIGTAFDEETFCTTFNGIRLEIAILVTTIKKPTALEQSLGRVMRSQSPETYILLDESSIINNHWYIMNWWFKEYTNCNIKPPQVIHVNESKRLTINVIR